MHTRPMMARLAFVVLLATCAAMPHVVWAQSQEDPRGQSLSRPIPIRNDATAFPPVNTKLTGDSGPVVPAAPPMVVENTPIVSGVVPNAMAPAPTMAPPPTTMPGQIPVAPSMEMPVTKLEPGQPLLLTDPRMYKIACAGIPFCDFPAYYVTGESMWLRRDNASNLTLGTLQFGANTLPTTNQLADRVFAYEPGARITLGRAITAVQAVELQFYGLFEHEKTQSLTAGNGLFLPTGFPTLQLNNLASQVSSYDSELVTFETNYRRYMYFNPNVSLLAGIRYARLDEDLTVLESGTFTNVFGQSGGAQGLLAISTQNQMIGPQVGLEIQQPVGDYLQLGINTRFAWMFNFAESTVAQSITTGIADPPASQTFDDRRDATGLFELGATIRVRLQRHLVLTGGYQVLFFQGLALAPQQRISEFIDNRLPNDPAPAPFVNRVETDGDSVYHGPFIGLSYEWGSVE